MFIAFFFKYASYSYVLFHFMISFQVKMHKAFKLPQYMFVFLEIPQNKDLHPMENFSER